MPRKIIDGDRWIAERLAFLRERLAAQPSSDERRAIETEMEMLSKERGFRPGRIRPGRMAGWLRRKR